MEPNPQFDHNPSRDELDHLLDEVLAKYAAVEPRVRLEERVLANLRAEQTPDGDRTWWRWGFVAAVLVPVAVFLAWRTTGPSHSLALIRQTVDMQPVAARAIQVAKSTKERKPPHLRPVKQRSRKSNGATVAADPKLDVFPSPQPATEEELALAQYIRNFPGDARLVAQAQQTSDTDVSRKMQALANESAKSN